MTRLGGSHACRGYSTEGLQESQSSSAGDSGHDNYAKLEGFHGSAGAAVGFGNCNCLRPAVSVSGAVRVRWGIWKS